MSPFVARGVLASLGKNLRLEYDFCTMIMSLSSTQGINRPVSDKPKIAPKRQEDGEERELK